VLRSVSSWSAGFTRRADETQPLEWELLSGRSEWLAEGRWEHSRLGDLAPSIGAELTGQHPKSSVARSSRGTWSTSGDLPTAYLSSPDLVWGWQIEHNGPWRWDVATDLRGGIVTLSGPTESDATWNRILPPGDTFESVPVSVSAATSRDDVIAALTRLRRASHRPTPRSGRVVFNDYMNTLNGDPTTTKLLPLVDAAANAGAEIFCIDAGWYSNEASWWDSVGSWAPSTTRFPGGLEEVTETIRAQGMVPGLWLEPEVIGVRSPVADQLPHEAFLLRHGQRIVEDGRYHLDMRHPAAQSHLDHAIDRLIEQFRVGYFKFDYNIDPGAGTDHDSHSLGDGLLQHNRAHLDWIERLLRRHPTLEVENCAAGAMRSDHAILSRLALQSTSDQQDPLLYPPIAAAAPLLMLPEQAANWAYPQPDMSDDLISFCLVTGLTGRLYLSGHLDEMSTAQLDLISRATTSARALASHIRLAVPWYPLGIPDWTDDVVALGLRGAYTDTVSVWKRSDAAVEVRVPLRVGPDVRLRDHTPVPADLDIDGGDLVVRFGRGPRAVIVEFYDRTPPEPTPAQAQDVDTSGTEGSGSGGVRVGARR